MKIAFFVHFRCIYVVSHSDYHACCSEIIDVMIYVVRPYAGKVRKYERVVERTCIDYRLWKNAVLIEKTHKRHHAAKHKGGHSQYFCEKLVRRIIACYFVIFFYKGIYFIVYIEYRIVEIEFHFTHGRICFARTHNDHCKCDLVSGIYFAVYDKTVQLIVFRNRPHKRRENNRKMTYLLPVFSRFHYIFVYVFIWNAYFYHILRIASVSHEIRSQFIHGVYIFYDFSVCSHINLTF